MNIVEATLGSVVRIKSADDDQSYMLVEPKDVDPFTYRISVESPFGKVFLHKHKNDLVSVEGPRIKQTYVVKEVIPGGLFGHMKGGCIN